MRVMGAAVIGLLAMSGVSRASSIVMLSASTSTPSVIRLNAIAKQSTASTPSMIALGDPVPAVTDEKVAAIPEKSGHQPAPMIIRGGIVGGAFSTPKATASAKPETPAATAPANGTATPPPPANGTAAASNGGKAGNPQKPTASASSDAEPQAQPQSTPTSPGVGKAM